MKCRRTNCYLRVTRACSFAPFSNVSVTDLPSETRAHDVDAPEKCLTAQ